MPKLRFSEPNYFQIKKQYLQNNNALVIAKVLKASCFFLTKIGQKYWRWKGTTL